MARVFAVLAGLACSHQLVAGLLRKNVTNPTLFFEDDAIVENSAITNFCLKHMAHEVDCTSTPWRPPAANDHQRMCIDGKEVPKLYVLGAQKTSTSSFARDLKCAGVIPQPNKDGSNWKEFHFFDSRQHWGGAHWERQEWLNRLPSCQANGGSAPSVLGDFSPDNLRMVPGEHPYGPVFLNMPKTLREFYGEDASKNITLVVMIREPLSRMHSAWYAAKMCGNFAAICTQDCRADTFQEAMRRALSNAAQSPPVYTEWLWTSMYARHLEAWLEEFDANQIYVVPYREYAVGNADGVCRGLAEKLGFEIDCESHGVSVSHEWRSVHPELDEDMPAYSEMRASFDKLMHSENIKLVNLLAEAHSKGLGLANYEGRTGSKQDIQSWLEAGW